VVYPRAPYGIVALPRQGDAAFGEVDPEVPVREQDQGRPLIIGSPPGAFVACRVDAPRHFHVLA